MTRGLPDPEALLVALTLAPATFSRNRFYALYAADPKMRCVRKRAATVRSVIRHLTDERKGRRGEIESVEALTGGRILFSYAVMPLGFRRTVSLEPIELSVVRYALGQAKALTAPSLALPPEDTDRKRIESALRRLLAPPPSRAESEDPGAGAPAEGM